MRGRTTLWVAMGAGLALWLANDRRRRQTHARAWRQKQPAAALVTGASSGIGAAFARVLAREGYDLILLARREDRLRSLAEEIERETPARVEIWKADLCDPAEIEVVEQRIAGLENLDLLVNNAGLGVNGKFATTDIQDSLLMVQLHITASMRLARAALPGMMARHHGGIIQVSSMASLMPFGRITVYGATKSYLNFFSEGLQLELAGSGVRLQNLCPGLTYSEFHEKSGRPKLPTIFWMDADRVAQESLIGLRENQLYVFPGTLNKMGAVMLTSPLTAPLIRWLRPLAQRAMPDR